MEALEIALSSTREAHAAALASLEEQLRVTVTAHGATLSEQATAHAAELGAVKQESEQSLASQVRSRTVAHEKALAEYDEQ